MSSLMNLFFMFLILLLIAYGVSIKFDDKTFLRHFDIVQKEFSTFLKSSSDKVKESDSKQ